MLKYGIGKSHAKIILTGEHSVVYHKPAIALPLPNVTAKAFVTLDESTSLRIIESSYFTGSFTNLPKEMLGIKKMILTILENLHFSNCGFTLKIESLLPSERGMGSSAAVSIAIIRAFYAALNQKLSETKLLQLAAIEEKQTHRNPSGLDALACSNNNPIWMIKNQEMYPIPINLNAYLLICDTGIKGKTSEAIATVKKQVLKNEQKTTLIFNDLETLAYKTRQALKNNDLLSIGKLMNQAQYFLKLLGVSSYELDYFINLSLNCGALGSKLTGGGKGGCFINILKSKQEAQKLSEFLYTKGIKKTWIQSLNYTKEGF